MESFDWVGYRIGNWYPFTDRLATIRDPKTTVAVGVIALLGHLDRLPSFRLDTSELQKVNSTVRYVGVMEAGGDRALDSTLALTPQSDAGTVHLVATPSLWGLGRFQ